MQILFTNFFLIFVCMKYMILKTVRVSMGTDSFLAFVPLLDDDDRILYFEDYDVAAGHLYITFKEFPYDNTCYTIMEVFSA